jgi:hypothetical protein
MISPLNLKLEYLTLLDERRSKNGFSILLFFVGIERKVRAVALFSHLGLFKRDLERNLNSLARHSTSYLGSITWRELGRG